jgi:hypothetical protein
MPTLPLPYYDIVGRGSVGFAGLEQDDYQNDDEDDCKKTTADIHVALLSRLVPGDDGRGRLVLRR